jgi:ubiquinone/menaquinone biosynthesis C-methylase UbiE
MKIRDSGMPEEQAWEQFFDARLVLRSLAFQGEGDVVDFGCGYGTFSIAAAELTRGTVYAFDIDPQMIATTAAKARQLGLSNVRTLERDFVSQGTGLDPSSAAYAMLFNILHAEDAVGLLQEAFRVLRPGGAVGIIHWIYDASTPRGPALSIRPRPEQCIEWATQVGFTVQAGQIALPPYHYGLIGRKPSNV